MKKIFQITIILLFLCTISAISADNIENSSNIDKRYINVPDNPEAKKISMVV
ncbi:MAG: hypothetical protein ACI4VJ_04475 [Methanosphaera sp.]